MNGSQVSRSSCMTIVLHPKLSSYNLFFILASIHPFTYLLLYAGLIFYICYRRVFGCYTLPSCGRGVGHDIILSEAKFLQHSFFSTTGIAAWVQLLTAQRIGLEHATSHVVLSTISTAQPYWYIFMSSSPIHICSNINCTKSDRAFIFLK